MAGHPNRAVLAVLSCVAMVGAAELLAKWAVGSGTWIELTVGLLALIYALLPLSQIWGWWRSSDEPDRRDIMGVVAIGAAVGLVWLAYAQYLVDEMLDRPDMRREDIRAALPDAIRAIVGEHLRHFDDPGDLPADEVLRRLLARELQPSLARVCNVPL